ncbi:TetR/AcrR family transcriptional regulator [Alicyclobacillus fructus]|uniref:TetR/AcrR family transcriptional regulator n=1 Tax=Alicyclobacillus fructus TaxID=2816082 RepID=UPI001F3F6EBC|nr:TetR/AcrR family transcriptional regulator [Alicyclobacillus fructus]
MAMLRRRPSKRNQILQAAAQLVRERGVGHLTLEAVAELAHVSKGGLLYHFPTKEELVKSMVSSIMDEFTTNMEKTASRDTDGPGKWTRAYVQETFKLLDGVQNMSVGLLAASCENPELLKPVQEHYDDWQRRIEQDDIDPVKATIIRLAADGLWFIELFGCSSLEPGLRKRVRDALIELTKEDLK